MNFGLLKIFAIIVSSCYSDRSMKRVFSYGSNSVSQLRARVGNPSLLACPARLQDWTRIFCMYSENWKGGSASIFPLIGAVTYGAVVELTPEELTKLDGFEGGYRREEINISLLIDDDWVPKTACAYIAHNNIWKAPPSEQYLTAIHLMLREQFSKFPSYYEHININGILEPGSHPVVMSQWSHPGMKNLGLESLCIEANAIKTGKKWVMPQAIREITAELRQIGITDTPTLMKWLATDLDKWKGSTQSFVNSLSPLDQSYSQPQECDVQHNGTNSEYTSTSNVAVPHVWDSTEHQWIPTCEAYVNEEFRLLFTSLLFP